MANEDEIVTFESYYDPMLAQIIRARLEANDISCFVADDNMLEIIPYYNQAMGGVKLKVFEKDLEKCREILAMEIDENAQEDLENDHQANAISVCPHCGSTDIRYGTNTEVKFHLPSIIVSLFTGVPIYFGNAWHCFNCSRNFE